MSYRNPVQFSDLYRIENKIKALETIGYLVNNKSTKRTRNVYHNDTEEYSIHYWEVVDPSGLIINPNNFQSDDADETVNRIINELHSKWLLDQVIKFGVSLNSYKLTDGLEIL